jgi:predicted AAA+ superfamily ATPase
MVDEPVPSSFAACREALRQRLTEPAPGRIQLLAGPRQVGKTTLLLGIAEELGDRAVYAALDGPEASFPGSWERLWARAGQLARRGPAVLLLDEIQHLPGWSSRVKGEWDRSRRQGLPLHLVASGSSSLRLGAGSRESLAGRFERLTLSHWPAAALVSEFGLAPADAAREVAARGAYPGAFPMRADPARWRAYVRDAILEPALARDVLALSEVRRPALLRQVFGAAAASPARVLSLQKIRGQLADRGALETVAAYLHLLEDAYLVAPLQKYSREGLRRRSAPPKLVTLSNALLAASHPEGPADPGRDPARYGAWVENACLAFAWNAGQRVFYWREEPWEVDGVLEGDWGNWALEVKTGGFSAADLRGLAEFTRRYPAFRPLVLCDEERLPEAERLGVPAMPWTGFLLSGPGWNPR